MVIRLRAIRQIDGSVLAIVHDDIVPNVVIARSMFALGMRVILNNIIPIISVDTLCCWSLL